jgi:hypothetical protein
MGPQSVHKSPPLDPILSQLNLFHTHAQFSRYILIFTSKLGLTSSLFFSSFPTKFGVMYLSYACHMYRGYHSTLDLITPVLIILGEASHNIIFPIFCSSLGDPNTLSAYVCYLGYNTLHYASLTSILLYMGIKKSRNPY